MNQIPQYQVNIFEKQNVLQYFDPLNKKVICWKENYMNPDRFEIENRQL